MSVRNEDHDRDDFTVYVDYEGGECMGDTLPSR